MKIPANEIKIKEVAGETKDGNPVVYVETVGGLHAFFCKNDEGQIEAIGAAPHRSIAAFLAEKKYDIKWNDEIKKSQIEAEPTLFEKLRKTIFAQSFSQPVGNEDLFMVYDVSDEHIEVMTKKELETASHLDDYALVRDFGLTKPATILKHSGIRK